ncbi:hypothetical protein [Nocardiopsis ansamitocini]|uniref:Cell division protein FtsL n=1 Tax=Nocardiopsis ansamitocini TaxID=1670832 RepID=A0A9W6P2N4_9ACTN|nr:hypothetical protein [Nocardiopsis ansamitocini]GLU45981.1 hypothetical protein Nans01_03320 [Nocardiopsis ansamitocini]
MSITEDRTIRSGTATKPRTRPASPPRPTTVPTQRGAAAQRPSARPPRMPFVLLVLGLLGGALVCLLVLRTVLAEDTFEISRLQQENRTLAQQEQALREANLHSETSEAIADAAEELGMEPGEAPRFIEVEGESAQVLTGGREAP